MLFWLRARVEFTVDVYRELESRHEKLEFIAVMLQLCTELLIEDKIGCCVNPLYKAYDLFYKIGTLINWSLFYAVGWLLVNTRASNKAVVKRLGDAH